MKSIVFEPGDMTRYVVAVALVSSDVRQALGINPEEEAFLFSFGTPHNITSCVLANADWQFHEEGHFIRHHCTFGSDNLSKYTQRALISVAYMVFGRESSLTQFDTYPVYDDYLRAVHARMMAGYDQLIPLIEYVLSERGAPRPA